MSKREREKDKNRVKVMMMMRNEKGDKEKKGSFEKEQKVFHGDVCFSR